MVDSKLIIEKLGLLPHPEGGYFKEIFRDEELIQHEMLPARYNSKRHFSNTIYYLLIAEQVSHFHRIKSNELWHFYSGSPVILHCLDKDNGYSKIILGNEFSKDIFPQAIITRGTWFAAEVLDKSTFSLVGCTVAPGFDFDDFEMAVRDKLINQFPQQESLIIRLTSDNLPL